MAGDSNKETIRVTVDMSPEVYGILSRLAADAGKSKADIMRLGLAIMSQAVPAVKEGKHIGIAADGDKLDKEFLGIIN